MRAILPVNLPTRLPVLIVGGSAEGRTALRRLVERRFAEPRFTKAHTLDEGVEAARRGGVGVMLLADDPPETDAAGVLSRLAVARGSASCPVVIVAEQRDERRAVRLLRRGAGEYVGRDELGGDPEHAAALLERAIMHARDQFRLARRAAVYRANTLVKRRRERVALDQAEASEQRLSMALAAADLGTWDWDVPGETVVHNDRLMAIVDYAPGEAAWTVAFWRANMHPDDAAEVGRQLDEHFAGRTARLHCEYRMRTKSGAWKWVAASGRVVARDAGGNPTRVTGVTQDVDARKRAEHNLVEARDAAEATRRRLADILTSISDGFAVLDADWRFTHVNPQAEELLNRSGDALRGRSIWEAFPGLVASPFEQAMRRAMDRRETTGLVAQFKPLDKWIDARFYPSEGGLSIFFLDVTDLKRNEAQLRQSEALARQRLRQLESVYSTAPAGLAFVDRERRYVSVNDRLARMHGLRAAEVVGRRLDEVLTPAMYDKLRPVYDRVLDHAQPQRIELGAGFAGVDPSRGHAFLADYIPVFDADGRVEGVNVVVSDITDRKRAEVALQAAMQTAEASRVSAERAKEIAERASQAKSEFLAVLSHELRTPLTPVLTGVQMLQQDLAAAEDRAGDNNPELCETLAMIRRNVELEVRLIDDLLDLTRLTRGKMPLNRRAVDLNEAVRHVLQICRAEMQEKGVRLSVELAAEPVGVTADPARLQQMLWNLIKNATKFTPAGGRVTVRTRRGRRATLRRTPADPRTSGVDDGPAAAARDAFTPPPVAAADLAPKAADYDAAADAGELMAVFEVQDTGIGIAPEVLPRVFTAFEQGGPRVTRTFGGLGLGLAISRALVLAHGGTLTARSDGPGQGATFTLALADRPLAPGEAAPPEPARDAAPARRARVLLVEDHADTARLMARYLERRLKLDVVTANTVEQGVAALADADGDGSFGLIISDIGLPDGTGVDFLRRVHALLDDPPPAVALSGYGTEQDVRNSHDAGFREHLTKPVDLEQLERAVRQMLA